MVGYSYPLSVNRSQLTARVAYSIALTCLSATQDIVQLIDSSERADTLFLKAHRSGIRTSYPLIMNQREFFRNKLEIEAQIYISLLALVHSK